MIRWEAAWPDRFVREIRYGAIGGAQPEVRAAPCGDRTIHCTLTFTLDRAVRQDDWQLSVEPAFAPTFHWAPHLAPTDRHVIDQHAFRSPALVVQDGTRTLILVPDLDLLAAKPPVRWYMDLDAPGNRLTLGMSASRPEEHVLFVREPGAVYPAGTVRIGFYLMTFEDEAVAADPWRPVLAFLWERWGSPRFRTGAPAAAPLHAYVRHAYDWAFKHWEGAVWQSFELDGRPVGACAFIVDATQSPNYPGPPDEREPRSIWNQAWFSSLRSAQGVYRYARRSGDAELRRRALLAKELALSAPQRDGLFPSVIATRMERVRLADGTEVNRSRGWEEAAWGHSNRNPLSPWTRGGTALEAPYHLLDMSWTALLMLRWHEELEHDDRLLAYVQSYAEALLALQDERGYFPAWLEPETMRPLPELSQSPETSMSVTFLLALHDAVPDPRYRAAALRAIDAVLADIVPIGRWEDFETYWSCCPYGAETLQGQQVARNGMFKQCNLSMFWTAESLHAAWLATGEPRYLAAGERCLDELLMTQASWQPPYIYVEALGGFGVMNADGEWNDARQSLFAELILRYGMALDRLEYIERGVAALRASFVMMYCPENEKTREQWEKAFPFFGEEDYGFMMENYGHDGRTGPDGLGMGRFTIFDWGNGAAAEAYLRIRDRLGEELERRYGITI
ncbi:glycoside hydrolase family 88 protein [Cohnella sp. REN36]|uniref:glycoside hydrolase family 88 protein n=1 Tax=Cohnella sp. REN36 TaxID=2887347 RepID=UPI001D1404D8|nr:glycoside hydrolase family 88 protein [Cohnella sp. REN36]MCC3375672.1 glycoside hydrolase family 88 protein [Cohnella sp. REN36]